MRVRQYICCVLLLFACLRGIAQKNLLDSIIHPDSLHALVKYLAVDSMKGRLTGTATNLQAAEFIADEFRKTGLRPVAASHGYLIPFKAFPRRGVVTSYNVVAALPGKSKSQK